MTVRHDDIIAGDVVPVGEGGFVFVKPCHVYWGSHGCSRPHGHDGDHWCDCCECDDHPDDDSGCVAGPPYYGPGTAFWGDDAKEAS